MTDELFLKKLGEKIAKLRKSKDLTQVEFSKMLKIPRTSLTRIELGNTNPTINMLRKISEGLDMSVEEMIKIE